MIGEIAFLFVCYSLRKIKCSNFESIIKLETETF